MSHHILLPAWPYLAISLISVYMHWVSVTKYAYNSLYQHCYPQYI